MDAVVLLGIFLFAAVSGFLAFFVFSPRKVQQPELLAPFAVLPVRNAEASTRAFLELFAGQVAWMDSSVLHSVILMYADEDTETAQMCAEIARQHDFFTCMSLSETQRLLALRLEFPESVEKNFTGGGVEGSQTPYFSPSPLGRGADLPMSCPEKCVSCSCHEKNSESGCIPSENTV